MRDGVYYYAIGKVKFNVCPNESCFPTTLSTSRAESSTQYKTVLALLLANRMVNADVNQYLEDSEIYFNNNVWFLTHKIENLGLFPDIIHLCPKVREERCLPAFFNLSA